MRNSGFVSIQSGLIVFLAFLISGCAASHSDVLLFGTNTKFALDASAPPETAGTPQLTIGYKRQEFVWMPLYVNGKDSKFIPEKSATKDIQEDIQDGKYIGVEGSEGNKDTYSVLASFGAKAEAGTGNASGGLAQMFATGIAARKLAERPSVTQLFTTQTAEGVDEAEVKFILEKTLINKAKDKKTLARFLEDDKGNVDVSKLKQILKDTGRDESWAETWNGKPVSEFTQWLDERDSAISRRFALNFEAIQ